MRRLLTALLALTTLLLFPSQAYAVAFPDGDVKPSSDLPVVPLFYNAMPGEWDPQQYCSGTVIAPQMVLTAAHCVQDLYPEQVLVGVESSRVSQPKLTAVTGIETHPRYLAGTQRYGVNDIAVLRLAAPMRVQATLPGTSKGADSLLRKSPLSFAGYGLDQNEVDADAARYSRADDYSQYGKRIYKGFNRKTQIAAGRYNKAEETFSAACAGDSGGPLFAKRGKDWVIVGVTSYGAEDCSVGAPGFFMRVGYYLPWIRQSLEDLVGSVSQAKLTYLSPSDRRSGVISTPGRIGVLLPAGATRENTSIVVVPSGGSEYMSSGDALSSSAGSCALTWSEFEGQAAAFFDPACLQPSPATLMDVGLRRGSTTDWIRAVAAM